MKQMMSMTGGRQSGRTQAMILHELSELSVSVKRLSKRVTEIENMMKDINNDVNDLFDEVVGNENGNNHKQFNSNK